MKTTIWSAHARQVWFSWVFCFFFFVVVVVLVEFSWIQPIFLSFELSQKENSKLGEDQDIIWANRIRLKIKIGGWWCVDGGGWGQKIMAYSARCMCSWTLSLVSNRPMTSATTLSRQKNKKGVFLLKCLFLFAAFTHFWSSVKAERNPFWPWERSQLHVSVGLLPSWCRWFF